MKGDGLHLWTIDLFIVGEEEPVSDPHVKELRVPSILLDQLKTILVAVPPSEEDTRFSLVPRDVSSLLDAQNREGDPVIKLKMQKVDEDES